MEVVAWAVEAAQAMLRVAAQAIAQAAASKARNDAMGCVMRCAWFAMDHDEGHRLRQPIGGHCGTHGYSVQNIRSRHGH
jgi:N-methylhydantoinase B/oxoprolinase/acetone carboxylase alpha subunit